MAACNVCRVVPVVVLLFSYLITIISNVSTVAELEFILVNVAPDVFNTHLVYKLLEGVVKSICI